MLAAEDLILHIRGCALNSRESQKIIFSSFYGYAMSVCSRYTNNPEDATEILNDGFLKVFKEVHRFYPAYSDVMNSFKGWLRKIMIYTSIDHSRKYYKYEITTSYNEKMDDVPFIEENALDRISYNEIIKAIRHLSPAYRTTLNLFVIEGFSHTEIAERLGITVGTSKSNLSKAKLQLQKILFSQQTVLVKNET